MDKLCRFEERVQRMDSIHISSPEQGIPHHVMYTGPSPAAPQHQQSFRQGQNEDQGQREGQGTAVRQQSSFKQPQQYRHGNSTSPLRGTQSAFMSAAAAPPAPPAPPGGSSLKRGGGPASPNGTTSTPAGRSPTRASTDPQAAQLHRVNSQPVNGTTQPPLSPAGRAPLSRSATMSAGSGANYFPTQAPLADKLLAKSYSFKKF